MIQLAMNLVNSKIVVVIVTFIIQFLLFLPDKDVLQVENIVCKIYTPNDLDSTQNNLKEKTQRT